LNRTIMTLKTRSKLAGLSRILRTLSLALIPALTTEAGQINLSHREQVARRPGSGGEQECPVEHETVPYLTTILAPALRFRNAPAPPSYELDPVATGPAFPEGGGMQPSMTGAQPEKPDPVQQSSNIPKPEPPAQKERKNPEPEASLILPDDTHREVHPEDLVPFFLYPKTGGRVVLPVGVPQQPPAPAQIPSSASYRQQ
jgi:hypothetical protein